MLPQPDEWSEWLLHRRHGDNREYEAIVRRVVDGYADRVLDDARLFHGMTLVDIGTGDGLLAFRAIERIGTSIRVVLTDISDPCCVTPKRRRPNATSKNNAPF